MKSKIIAFPIITMLLAILYWATIYNSTRVVNINGAHITFATFKKMEQTADLVIEGKPIKDFEDREHRIAYFENGDIQDFYTLTEIEVERILKQPSDLDLDNSNTIKIAEPNSMIQTVSGKQKLVDSEYQEIKKNNKYILFLKKNSKGTYCLINLNNGKFNIDKPEHENESLRNDVFKKYGEKLGLPPTPAPDQNS